MSANINDALKVLTPTAQWALTDVYDYNTLQWFSSDIAQPTYEQVQDEITAIDVQEPFVACKNQASKLLYETDWTSIPDVASPSNNPYLTNQAEFLTYRQQLRQLAVNPVADPVWPTVPTAQWSS